MNDVAKVRIDMSAHEERIRAARTALVQHLEDERTAYAPRFKRPTVSTETGEHQRLQTRVPTRADPKGTVVSMGRRADGRNHDGFGLTTIAHVDVSAAGGKAESRMTLQANGQVVLQSDDDSAYVLAAGPTVLASSAVTNVLGAAGVVIGAGASIPVAPIPIQGESPAAPNATSGHADAMRAEVDAWTNIDGAIASALSDRDQLQRDLAPSQASEVAPAKEAADLPSLVRSTLRGPNELGAAAEGQGGGLALTSTGGIVVVTPESGAIHGAKWLELSSTKLALVGTELVDVTAASLLSLNSGEHARLYARSRVDVVAHSQPLHLASRTGEALEVQAKAIRVGATQPAEPQEATASVAVASTTHVGLSTGNGAPGEGQAGIHLHSHDVIAGKAGATVVLEAAESLTLRIAGQEIAVVVDKNKSVTLKVDDSTIVLSRSRGVSIKHGVEVLKGSKTSCFLGPSASNRVEATTSQVAIKGSSIKIG